MKIKNVGELIDHLTTHFQDSDEIRIEGSMDRFRSTFYSEDMDITYIEYEGLGEGKCVLSVSGDVTSTDED